MVKLVNGQHGVKERQPQETRSRWPSGVEPTCVSVLALPSSTMSAECRSLLSEGDDYDYNNRNELMGL